MIQKFSSDMQIRDPQNNTPLHVSNIQQLGLSSRHIKILKSPEIYKNGSGYIYISLCILCIDLVSNSSNTNIQSNVSQITINYKL